MGSTPPPPRAGCAATANPKTTRNLNNRFMEASFASRRWVSGAARCRRDESAWQPEFSISWSTARSLTAMPHDLLKAPACGALATEAKERTKDGFHRRQAPSTDRGSIPSLDQETVPQSSVDEDPATRRLSWVEHQGLGFWLCFLCVASGSNGWSPIQTAATEGRTPSLTSEPRCGRGVPLG